MFCRKDIHVIWRLSLTKSGVKYVNDFILPCDNEFRKVIFTTFYVYFLQQFLSNGQKVERLLHVYMTTGALYS